MPASQLLMPEQFQLVENPKLTVPGLRLPEGFNVRPYQLNDAAWLAYIQRAILAEYAGAGKKLIAIMAALKLFSLFKAKNVLVVSLGNDCEQWVKEIDLFTEGVTTQLYRADPKERRWMIEAEHQPDFRVCTYHTAVADLVMLANLHDIIILDEVSYVKNPDTHATRSIRAVCAPSLQEQHASFVEMWMEQNPERRVPDWKPNDLPSRYVWGLSATPYETSPIDLFSLFRVIRGNQSPLGTDISKFKRYCVIHKTRASVPIRGKRRKDGKPARRSIRIEKVTGLQDDWRPEVARWIRPYYMRHPWEVIEPYLPKLSVITVPLEFGKRQRDRYIEISQGRVLADYVFQDKGVRLREKDVTAAVKLFYQLRCCDGLTSLPGQKHRDSVKLQWTMGMLTGELGGEKVLVYSRYHQPLDDLQSRLDDNFIGWTRIDGNKNDEENEIAREQFWDDPRCLICLVTDKAGYALNLHAAHYGIAYNRRYNPFKIDQLHGRIRRGEGDKVIWYHLTVEHTSEWLQWDILANRAEEAEALGLGMSEEIFKRLGPSQQLDIVNYGMGAIAA